VFELLSQLESLLFKNVGGDDFMLPNASLKLIQHESLLLEVQNLPGKLKLYLHYFVPLLFTHFGSEVLELHLVQFFLHFLHELVRKLLGVSFVELEVEEVVIDFDELGLLQLLNVQALLDVNVLFAEQESYYVF
jgi:hypothetical protein